MVACVESKRKAMDAVLAERRERTGGGGRLVADTGRDVIGRTLSKDSESFVSHSRQESGE